MHAFLRAHPEVFMPSAKEIHYFGSDLQGLPYELDQERYHALFRGTEGKRRVGATCAMALYSNQGAEEIRREVPDAKIVMLLRDPVEMMYAFHSELVYQGMEHVKDFRKAVLLEPERKRGRGLPQNSLPPSIFLYCEMASYAEQVHRFYAHFPQEQIHVILFDDFQKDLPGVYRRLLQFLEVNPEFRPKFSTINPNKRVRSLRLRRLLSQPGPREKALARALIPWRDARQRMSAILSHWNVNFAPRSRMNLSLRRRLASQLAPDVERLSQIIKHDLSHWLSEATYQRSESRHPSEPVDFRSGPAAQRQAYHPMEERAVNSLSRQNE